MLSSAAMKALRWVISRVISRGPAAVRPGNVIAKVVVLIAGAIIKLDALKDLLAQQRGES